MESRSHVRRFRHLVSRYVNPFTRLFAGWMPGFGILVHRGHRSGRTYRTPINAFRRGSEFVFFLTYGSDVHWVRNVVSAGGCTLRTRGRDVVLVEPELLAEPERRLAPRPARVVGRIIGARRFLRMRVG